jgi:hypothetical protein
MIFGYVDYEKMVSLYLLYIYTQVDNEGASVFVELEMAVIRFVMVC